MPSKIMVSDSTAIKYGFKDGGELREMMSEVIHIGMKNSEIYDAFSEWLDEDMTKKGLVRILDRAKRINRD